jgi:large repetitive protein
MKNWMAVGLMWLALPINLLSQGYQPMHLGMTDWYFGNSPNGINFNRATRIPAVITNKVSPFGSGGSATASDPINGNLLFYSDGSNVYDASNLLMPTGSGLLGNPASNQPVAFCPVPGVPNKYFIFSNSATNTVPGSITYDVVDLSLLGNSLFPSTVPLGDLEGPFHVALGLIGRAEAMTVVPHTNGIDYWLLTQVANSQDYTATLINAATYTPAHTGTFTHTTSTPLGLVMSASHFAYHAGGAVKRLAVAPTTANTDAIILNFNDASGAFTFSTAINNSASGSANNQAIYDIEWSGDGNYVYYSVFGDQTAAISVAGNVFQFDFVNPTVTLASVLPATVFRSYGLQLAPDSSIYHLYQSVAGGPFLIGKISDPDSVAALSNYIPAQFPTVANWNATQFSATLPKINPVITVTFTSTGTCQNTPTSFYPTVTPYADSLVWDFDDGSPTVNAWSPIYTYQNAGTYNVSVTAFFQGQPQLPPTINPVNINAFPLQLQLVADTTACTFEFPPPKGTSGPPLFSVTATVSGGAPTTSIWSNGDTGLTLTPDSAGYYYLVVADGSGCSAYAGVNVREYDVPDQRRNIWYFGNRAGIDFNPTPPIALNDGAMNAPEGCSAMSDRNGEIIFYTDGNNVYDQTHTLIASGIGGDPTSTQSALIVPVPGDETLYYIFTTEAKEDYPTNAIYYSLFDLKQNSGTGAVTIQNQLLYTGSTERLASNGNWLITHEYGNNSFRCFQVTPTGLGFPVISSIGSDHLFSNSTLAEGYMKIGANNVVAVPLSVPGTSNVIEVFDFDTATGTLSNFRSVNLLQPSGQVYGIEFLGNKMFATIKGPPSLIREMYFDFQNNPVLIPPNAASSGPFTQELGALQLGPDGQIYMAINGSASLGTFTTNPDTLQLSTVNFSGFALAGGTTSALGLPNFVQSTGSAFGGPGMNVAGFCFGTPMDYVATPTDPIDTFLWGFGDGGGSTLQSGQYSYGAAGAYTVTLLINNRCLIHDGTPPFTFSQNITIVNPPAPPTIPATAALCTAPITLDANAANVPGLTYLWNTTETTRQISVNAVGTYSVVITDATGCTSNGATNMQDARPPVNLGPDRTVCQGSFLLNLNAQNPPPAFSHAWTLDGVANGNTTPTQSVSTATVGTDTYQVTVTNIATNCSTVENVTFVIVESPRMALTAFPTTACLTPTGRIELTILPLVATTQPPNHTFSYIVAGPVSSSAISQPSGLYNINNLSGGNYSVFVVDNISGCSDTGNATVSDPANTLTAPNIAACLPIGITATTNAHTVPVAGNFTYRVFNSSGTLVDNGTANASPFTTANLTTPGTYTLEVTKSTCVTAVNNIVITQNPQVTFTTTQNACAASPTITGSAGPTYTWAGANPASAAIIQSQTTSVLTLNKVAGVFSFNVTATQGGSCPSTQVVPITLEAAPTPTITPSDPCQNQVTLSAAPAGFSFQWYRNSVLDLTLLGQQISLGLADNGNNYEVELVSSLTGCTYRSAPPLTASVIGPVTAAISSTPACDDGSAFIISAFTAATTPTYTWSRDVGTGFRVITAATRDTTAQTVAGTYRVRISKGVCFSEASIQLIKAPLPVGALPNLVVICDDPENADPTTDHYDLDPGLFEGYDWFVKRTEQSPETRLNFTDQVYTADKKGFYRVQLTNTFGCKADDFTEVLNDCVPKFYIPNAFRPSSNVAENKNFFAKTFFIADENFKVFLFNRWGELIFESTDRFFQWNGGYNNDPSVPVPSGAYAYVIEYVSTFRPDQGVQQKRGGVMLLR